MHCTLWLVTNVKAFIALMIAALRVAQNVLHCLYLS